MKKTLFFITVVAVLITSGMIYSAERDNTMENTAPLSKKYTNHLAGESSPYLLSHAHNPVDWYPWGDEALAKARKEDKPIFLSIGYAACHWCHVMEKESFENEAVAEVLNKYFVCIKVDREQRPDLDEIYMSFTTAMTGRGGWPMSVFLTPDLKPFFAGTYFPPDNRYGRPGFMSIITEIARAYREDKQALQESAESIYKQVLERAMSHLPSSPLPDDIVEKTARALMQNVDHVNGGFGDAPKFPHARELSSFLRHYYKTKDSSYLQAAEHALRAMAHGGIYDHIGGGFARYSTDAQWRVPHFEKMLYDNALLVPVYAEVYRLTRDEFYRKVIRETLDLVLREMTDTSGGFYASLDADSEGEEGKFYLWEKQEVESILGKDQAGLSCRYYHISSHGNFEGKNILYVNADSEKLRRTFNPENLEKYLDESRQKLFDVRSRRIRPATDDKILTSWNGLALSALCQGYQVTGDVRYLSAAVKNASFIQKTLYNDGHLTHSYREGQHIGGDFLEDYAYLIQGLLDLYETDTGNNYRWLEFASTLLDIALALFLDEQGRFYLRPDNQSDLVFRPQNETDGALPAPGSVMIMNLLKMSRLTENKNYHEKAELALTALAGKIVAYPHGMVTAVAAWDYLKSDKIEIVMVGGGTKREEMLAELYRRYLPDALIATSITGEEPLPLFEGRREIPPDGLRVYLCRNSACQLPVTTIDEFRRQLDELTQ